MTTKKTAYKVEIYRLTKNKKYCRDYAHTDNIEFIAGTITGLDRAYIARLYRNAKLYKNEEILIDEIMEFEEYNNRINENSSELTKEEFGDVPIRVIVIG